MIKKNFPFFIKINDDGYKKTLLASELRSLSQQGLKVKDFFLFPVLFSC
jgi:hypothetical protein